MIDFITNSKNKIKKLLPFDIWDYAPESFQRIYTGRPLLFSKKIRDLKKTLISGNATWDDLASYANIANYDNKHKFYQSALCAFDQEINFNGIKGADFLGAGLGIGSLNCYRKVFMNSEGQLIPCFEKIYDRKSPDFKKMIWFYNTIFDQLKDDLNIPGLVKVNGEKLGVAYFEWVNKYSVSEDDIIKRFITIISALGKVTLAEKDKANTLYNNYFNDSLFIKYFQRSRQWLCAKFESEQASILERLSKSALKESIDSKRFVHGNISRSNLIGLNSLIDFDNCGFYPLEYEIGSFLTSAYSLYTLDSYIEKTTVLEEKYSLQFDREWTLLFTFIFNLRIKHSEGKDYIKMRDCFLKELWTSIGDTDKYRNACL